MKRRNAVREAVLAELKALGVAVVEHSMNKRCHEKLKIEVNGRTATLVLASNKSCPRAHKNAVADVRRTVQALRT